MKTLQVVGTSLVVALVVTFGYAALVDAPPSPLGGGGQDWFNEQFFHDGLSGNLKEEGVITTLTATSTAQVLTAAQVCDSNLVVWDVTTASSTLTLPAATTTVANGTCMDEDGDRTTFFFDATSASTTVVTITTGTGIELVATDAGDDLIDNGNQARVDLLRTSSTTFIGFVEEFVAAD